MIVSRTLALASTVLVALAGVTGRLAAQTVAEHVVLGNNAFAARNGVLALHHFEEAVRLDSSAVEARLKVVSTAVDVGEYHPDGKERERLYVLAELYARRAVEESPTNADAHFQLAKALGRRALSIGPRERVKYAADIRAHALETLRLNREHAGALHVMGMWNYNVMRLNGVTRFLARRLLGGKVFDTANWDDAQRYMEESARLDPDRIVHRLDLARVLAARDRRDSAREQYRRAASGALLDYNDASYRSEAAVELRKLR